MGEFTSEAPFDGADSANICSNWFEYPGFLNLRADHRLPIMENCPFVKILETFGELVW